MASPMEHTFRIRPAGDAAIVIELEERVDPEINARALALARAIAAAKYAGIHDVVPAFRSVSVYFDPLRIDPCALEAAVAGHACAVAPEPLADAPVTEIPVCYGKELGPDLSDVARFVGCSEDEVVQIHSGRVYRVYMLGFVPGFSYMGTLDPRLVIPRRATPRVKVPAGSLAIAGVQTGIYPIETPGGWHLIGRSPVKLFDLARPEPFLLRPGAHVRFVPIDAATFRDMQRGA